MGQLGHIHHGKTEKLKEEFQREIEMMNREERQLSIHLTPGEYSEEKWKWIFEDIHQFSEIKIGVKSCYALYKELYR